MDMKPFIDSIVNKVPKAVDDDYIGDDDLLYCHKCHTPKQCKISIFGVDRIVPCICKCQEEERDNEEKARKEQEAAKQIQRLRSVGFPESNMQTWTFANDDMENERVTKAMKRYVENFEKFCEVGKGLLLYGSVGTGKTFAACEIANALIDKGIPVMVTNFARIINTLQGTFEKQEYIDSFNRYRLLVIDDLGIERDTPFAKEQVFNIIDSRYRAGLPLIVTTNLTINEIKTPNDTSNSRIYDRILERCFPIEVTGQSRRRKAVRESYSDMKELLGL